MTYRNTTQRPIRLAFARVFHEANSFSPLVTERGDFERFHFIAGDELARATAADGHELVGFLKNAELSGFVKAASAADVELVPLSSALAVPNGPLSMDAFNWLRRTLLKRISEAGQLDGMYLALHGSMRVVGLQESPEAVLLREVRAVLGDTPLVTSYDLHANLVPDLVSLCDGLVAYQTNPHRDLYRTGKRAGRLLRSLVRRQIRPTASWRKLPMVLGGGTTIDFLSPMRPIFWRLRMLERRPDVLAANLFMVHPYSDAADLGWAVHVLTDNDPALADRLADNLAELVWAVRKVPLPRMLSASEALQSVVKSRWSRALGTVCMVDMDDIVGTGAPGGNTRLLRDFIHAKTDLAIYVPLHDPALVEELWNETGDQPRAVTLRGTPGGDQPELNWQARVASRRNTDFGRTLLLEAGGIRVAVTQRPPCTIHPRFWRELGISPWKADAIVQKSLFHYRIFYAVVARGHLPIVSDGPSSLRRVGELPFSHPVWPRDNVADWRSFDAAQREQLPVVEQELRGHA